MSTGVWNGDPILGPLAVFTPPFQLSLSLLREIMGQPSLLHSIRRARLPETGPAPEIHILRVHPSSLASLWTMAIQERSGYPRHSHHCHCNLLFRIKKEHGLLHTHTVMCMSYHTHVNISHVCYTCYIHACNVQHTQNT